MANVRYTWECFAANHENATKSFERLTRQLFKKKFVDDETSLFTGVCLAGIEVEPVPRKRNSDNQQEKISFQSKYFEQGNVNFRIISDSAEKIVKYWKGKLDCVYLFSNLSFKKENKSYIKIEKLLNNANIEIIPILGEDLIDLAMEFPEISDRYFVYDVNGVNNNIIFNTHNTVVNNITVNNNHSYAEDLSDLFDEQLSCWRQLLFDLNFKQLKDRIISFLRKPSVPERYSNYAKYYHLLLSIRDNENIDHASQMIIGHDLAETNWLNNFYQNTSDLSYTDFIQHGDEVKVLILDRLFGLHNWDCIIDLFENSEERDNGFFKCFTFLYGLSLFNVGRFKESFYHLNRLFETSNKVNVHFYALLAELKFSIKEPKNNERDIHNLINELNIIKKKTSICEEDKILSLLAIMEALLTLDEFEELIKLYDEQSELIKANEAASYYYAISLESLGRYDEAALCYSRLNWVINEAITARYMMCSIHSNNYFIVTDIYNQCKSKSSTVIGLYLYNLLKSKHPDYTQELNSAIKMNQDNLHDLINVLYFVSDEYVISSSFDIFTKLLNDEALENWKPHEVDQLLMFIAKHNAIDLIERVLKSISNVSIVSVPVAYGIVNSIFDYSKRYSLFQNINQEDRKSLQSIESIANLFIDANTLVQDYLRIAMFASRLNNKPNLSLQYSKRLFKDCKDVAVSRNIVPLILELNLITEEIDLLSDAVENLKQSDIPSDSMILANAMLRIGKYDESDYYVYKTLCLLENEINYAILEKCLQYFISNQKRIKPTNKIRSVRKNCVVIIKDLTNDTIQNYCLNSELDLQHINHALGIEHLCPNSNSAHYYSLLNKGIGQEFRRDGKMLKIVDIIDRISFAEQYVWKRFNDAPQNFPSLTMIHFNDAEELIDGIKRTLKQKSDAFESILKFYYFENNGWGIPVDVLCLNDYSIYLEKFAFLLFAPNQAFYGGEVLYEDENNQVYVPDFSTLVLAFMLKIDKIFDAIKDDLLIPDSYLVFLNNLLDTEILHENNSVGSISLKNEQLILNNPDKSNTTILTSILEFCHSCKIVTVSSEERGNFKIFNNDSCEQFFTNLNISLIHLDAFILAKREHASLLCDDLFFRNLATRQKIRNINLLSIMMHLYKEMDLVIELILTLSKTNYLGIPLIFRDKNEYNQLYDNLMCGARKRQYYGPIFKQHYNDMQIRLKQLLGNDLVVQILRDSGFQNPDMDVSKDTITGQNPTLSPEPNHDH